MRAYRKLSLIIFMSWAAASCAFVESAFDYTFGEKQIQRLIFEVRLPQLDDLPELGVLSATEIPGFPASLARTSLAHLQGLMTVTGTCSHDMTLDLGQLDPRVSQFASCSITSCKPSNPCEEACGDLDAGMIIETSFEIELIDAQMAAEIQKVLASASHTSIVQVRLRFFRLEPFQPVGPGADDVTAGEEAIENTISKFKSVQLLIRDDYDNELLIVDHWGLEEISAETPQRYDMDVNSDLINYVKAKLMSKPAMAVQLTFVLRMEIDQGDLYELRMGASGIAVEVQPEFVVSVLEAAKSKL